MRCFHSKNTRPHWRYRRLGLAGVCCFLLLPPSGCTKTEQIELPCDDVVCGAHAQCAIIYQYTLCVCDTGFKADADDQCLPIPDPCREVDCGGHGQCAVDGLQQARCLCDPGYEAIGLTCREITEPCPDSNCSDLGICRMHDDQAQCHCDNHTVAHGPDQCAKDVSYGLCRTDGWCWQNPLPTSFDARAIWVAEPEDVWVVGATAPNRWLTGQRILHWDGQTWQTEGLPSNAVLNAIWGNHAKSLWVAGHSAGQGKIFRRQDGVFQEVAGDYPEEIFGIWGSSEDNIWLVGGQRHGDSSILHFNGQEVEIWPIEGRGVLTDVWGWSEDNVWALGNRWDGTDVTMIWHFDGTQWELIRSIEDLQLNALWACANDHIWAVGDKYYSRELAIYHWDRQGGMNEIEFQTGIKGSLHDIFGTNCADIWALGESHESESGGLLMHYNGRIWQQVSPSDRRLPTMQSGSVTQSGAMWMAGGNALVRRPSADAKLEIMSGGQNGLEAFRQIWARAPDDVWAAGQVPWHFDGKSWAATDPAQLRCAPGDTGTGSWLLAGTENELWAFLPGRKPNYRRKTDVLMFDGQDWQCTDSISDRLVVDTQATSATDIWILLFQTDRPIILHYDGKFWVGKPGPAIEPNDDSWRLQVQSDQQIWVYSSNSWNPWLWDGQQWTETVNQFDDKYFWIEDMWGKPDGGLWATGRTVRDGTVIGFVARWQEDCDPEKQESLQCWSLTLVEDARALHSIWGSGPEDLWAAGTTTDDLGIILHFDGDAWSISAASVERDLRAITGFGPEHLWVVGDHQTILYRQRP